MEIDWHWYYRDFKALALIKKHFRRVVNANLTGGNISLRIEQCELCCDSAWDAKTRHSPWHLWDCLSASHTHDGRDDDDDGRGDDDDDDDDGDDDDDHNNY